MNKHKPFQIWWVLIANSNVVCWGILPTGWNWFSVTGTGSVEWMIALDLGVALNFPTEVEESTKGVVS